LARQQANTIVPPAANGDFKFIYFFASKSDGRIDSTASSPIVNAGEEEEQEVNRRLQKTVKTKFTNRVGNKETLLFYNDDYDYRSHETWYVPATRQASSAVCPAANSPSRK